MQMPRRTTALASFALVLAPVLSSCGFDNATDRDYTPGVGANDRSGQAAVAAGVVVSGEDGEGVLIASFSNKSTTEAISLTDVTAEDITVEGVPELEIPQGGFHNLAEDKDPITLSGDFVAGNFVPVTLAFSNGEQVTIKMPVVRNCGDYADVPGLRGGEETCPSGNDLIHEGGEH